MEIISSNTKILHQTTMSFMKKMILFGILITTRVTINGASRFKISSRSLIRTLVKTKTSRLSMMLKNNKNGPTLLKPSREDCQGTDLRKKEYFQVSYLIINFLEYVKKSLEI